MGENKENKPTQKPVNYENMIRTRAESRSHSLSDTLCESVTKGDTTDTGLRERICASDESNKGINAKKKE
jgi:hypothetical protein